MAQLLRERGSILFSCDRSEDDTGLGIEVFPNCEAILVTNPSIFKIKM